MATANDILRDRGITRAVVIERFENGLVADARAFLKSDVLPAVDARVAARLATITERGLDVGPVTTARLRDLRAGVNKIVNEGFAGISDGARNALIPFASDEVAWQASLVDDFLPARLATNSVSLRQLTSIVASRPFEGAILGRHFSTVAAATVERLDRTIKTGLIQGLTTPQIIASVRDTYPTIGRQAEAVVRTAATHTANWSREAYYENNESVVKGVQWLSTLDTNTCLECMGLDGQVFKPGIGPRPPAHHQCRCTTIPVLKSFKELGIKAKEITATTRASLTGQVPARQTYPGWLRAQNRATQNAALGPTRASIFRHGQLRLSRFTGSDGKILTIKELRQAEARLAANKPITPPTPIPPTAAQKAAQARAETAAKQAAEREAAEAAAKAEIERAAAIARKNAADARAADDLDIASLIDQKAAGTFKLDSAVKTARFEAFEAEFQRRILIIGEKAANTAADVTNHALIGRVGDLKTLVKGQPQGSALRRVHESRLKAFQTELDNRLPKAFKATTDDLPNVGGDSLIARVEDLLETKGSPAGLDVFDTQRLAIFQRELEKRIAFKLQQTAEVAEGLKDAQLVGRLEAISTPAGGPVSALNKIDRQIHAGYKAELNKRIPQQFNKATTFAKAQTDDTLRGLVDSFEANPSLDILQKESLKAYKIELLARAEAKAAIETAAKKAADDALDFVKKPIFEAQGGAAAPNEFDWLGSHYTKFKGSTGSNPGGFYRAANGEELFVKFPKAAGQAFAEDASASLARKMGLQTNDYQFVRLTDGRVGVASKVEKLKEFKNASQISAFADQQALTDQLVHAAWTRNWDAVGLTADNLVLRNGKLLVVDHGGSLKWRAQGALKPGGLPKNAVPELGTLRTVGGNTTAKAAFGHIDDIVLANRIKVTLEPITGLDIQKALSSAKFTGKELVELRIAMIDRRKSLLNWADDVLGKVGVEAKAKPALTTKKAVDAAAKKAGSQTNLIPVTEAQKVAYEKAVEDYNRKLFQRGLSRQVKKDGTLTSSYEKHLRDWAKRMEVDGQVQAGDALIQYDSRLRGLASKTKQQIRSAQKEFRDAIEPLAIQRGFLPAPPRPLVPLTTGGNAGALRAPTMFRTSHPTSKTMKNTIFENASKAGYTREEAAKIWDDFQTATQGWKSGGQRAIKSYQTGKLKPGTRSFDRAKTRAESLEKGFKLQNEGHEGTIWRGETWREGVVDRNWMVNYLENHDTWTFPYNAGFSTEKHIANSFGGQSNLMFEIRGRSSASSIRNMKGGYGNENEILVKKGSRYRIDSWTTGQSTIPSSLVSGGRPFKSQVKVYLTEIFE